MHAKLLNSSDCEIGHIKEDTNEAAIAKIAAEWLPLLQEGDRIVIVSVQAEDPLDDFNYVGSRHHY